MGRLFCCLGTKRRQRVPPFLAGCEVVVREGVLTGVPAGISGTVRYVFRGRDGAWLADVDWANGGVSRGIGCDALEYVPLKIDGDYYPTERQEDFVSDACNPGQEGPTPDFIPGWFAPRQGNPDPAIREAVRIPEVGDHFPVIFLRDTERVSPASDHCGFMVGPTSQSGHDRFDLVVVPGCWLVRFGYDGHLQIRTDLEFKATYMRVDHKWVVPAERFRDNPHLSPEQRAEMEDQLRFVGRLNSAPAGWEGTPPAEGTRRALIRDTILAASDLAYGPGGPNAAALRLADAIERALLKVETQTVNAVVETLDLLNAPEGATSAERIDRLYRGLSQQLEEKRDEAIKAHLLLDALGVSKGPEISPPTVLNRLRALGTCISDNPHLIDEDRKHDDPVAGCTDLDEKNLGFQLPPEGSRCRIIYNAMTAEVDGNLSKVDALAYAQLIDESLAPFQGQEAVSGDDVAAVAANELRWRIADGQITNEELIAAVDRLAF